MCEYVDDECEPTYVWCQGKVVELVMQTDTKAVVKIEWNETCLQHGDPKVTKHVLKRHVPLLHQLDYHSLCCTVSSDTFSNNLVVYSIHHLT